jgi:protein SCO1/2
MNLSARSRMLFGFVMANLAIVAVAAVVYFNRPTAPPQIQGVLLSEASSLPAFRLIDQGGDTFTNSDLLGRWHLVSYGFTTCPDICPTTLSQLSTAITQLGDQADDLRVLFYTVDHRRDTVSQLAAYLPFFNEEFVGLTHLDDPDNTHLPFEQGLGMVARLIPDADPDSSDYQVVHGLTLFLLNPRGELQAIFEPGNAGLGVRSHHPDKLAADYLAVRQYLARESSPAG